MTMIPRREYIDFIAADGTVYPLHVPAAIGRWVISEAGMGMPPIEYSTTTGPAQHGETVRDYRLTPRTIQLLIRQGYCNRPEYWSGRAGLLDAIRPNRQLIPTSTIPGTLRKTLPDGSRRSFDVFIAEGPRFEPRSVGVWDEFALQEVLRFIAYNPVAYDPAPKSATFAPSLIDLVFPITFPITFGALDVTASVAYVGTWPEYPAFELTGPMVAPLIENLTTGEFIQLAYDIPAGDVVTVALSYGAKQVTDSNSVNLIGTVTTDSDLATFHLAPDPEASGGVNLIRISGGAVSAPSGAVMRWYTRFIGI